VPRTRDDCQAWRVYRFAHMLGTITVMRSIPVIDDESVAIARSYDEVADMLLLDSHRPGDVQIGALSVTHSWEIAGKS